MGCQGFASFETSLSEMIKVSDAVPLSRAIKPIIYCNDGERSHG